MAVSGNCAFCGQHGSLRESHVLPAFVYRWLRKRSGTGHIRNTENPNRRVQDGLKLYWLCVECEAVFSRYETAFATRLFHPWQKEETKVPYSDWLLKFCVSVSWRVLCYARGRNPEAKYTTEQHRLMDEAEIRWRDFLKSNVPHPGKFEQHLLIFDIIESTTVKGLPNNFNRYMTGAVTLDIVGSEKTLMTYAKLGRFNIFGIIQLGPNKWENTKIHVRHGVIQAGQFVVPKGLLNLFREKAMLAAQATEALSPVQQELIRRSVDGDLARFTQSDQFRSMQADAEMFGVEAVLAKKSTP